MPINVGAAAINPVPRQQIAFAIGQAASLPSGLRVVISAPEGERRARETMNARLGIVGGISILGTQGIVRPFSHDAYRASIRQAVKVAQALGCEEICFATGRRSLKCLARVYPHLPEQSFVVAGDFARDSLMLAKEFKTVAWGCFFGKLVKLAQGLGNTHARRASLDRDFWPVCLASQKLEP